MKIILLIGIPASGKSSFYQSRFAASHLRINLDMLRTRHRERSLFEWCLAMRQPCVIDDTNTTRGIRATWIEPAIKAGFVVTGYFMQSRIADCLERNGRRTGKACIPAAGVQHHHSQLQLPKMEEGFAALHYVRLDGDDFKIETWNDEI